ncbi:type VI secretion system baseplate subunit TssF [Succinivibrio dextrinosolvens]|uniref:Type VI secretion protein, VC_A0110 family n=1 Tax=Succinivibrio dextrinosolvens TaxID=83771 RepID=A0A662Z6Q6_9GAMM|nr:type VI secretion system baseplate subunit TssF [Succinivibrio dextrinosolvens]SFJ83622.1 type VI secretion protein, VC_A0110 family [Succinivibrio dextrinosolvens]
MNEDFLSYYRENLVHLRQMGTEFGAQFPKVASRLNLSKQDSQDPFVERLLEGTAFLVARAEKKFDDGYPELLQQILNKVCPLASTPVPAASVVNFTGSGQEFKTEQIGYSTVFDCNVGGKFSSSLKLSPMWRTRFYPLSVSAASYESSLISILPTEEIDALNLKTALRMTVIGCKNLKDISVDTDGIDIYLDMADSNASRLAYCFNRHLKAVYVEDEEGNISKLSDKFDCEFKAELGENIFDEIFGYMPGISLLQMYFSYPFLYHFINIKGLLGVLNRAASNSLNLIFAFTTSTELRGEVTASSIKFSCLPVINLFKMRSSRLTLNLKHEFHVSADRSSSLDYEIFKVENLELYDSHNVHVNTALPFYSFRNSLDNEDNAIFFSSVRRDRLEGIYLPRSNYQKTEVFVSLSGALYNSALKDLQEFTANLWCSNADLPLFLGNGKKVNTPDGSGAGSFVLPLTYPRPAFFMRGDLNGFSRLSFILMNLSAQLLQHSDECKVVLQNLIQIFYHGSIDEKKILIGAINKVETGPSVFRFVETGHIYFEKGFKVDIVLDESNLTGFGVYALGSVLRRVLCDFTSLNLLIRFSLYGVKSGLICSWTQEKDR